MALRAKCPSCGAAIGIVKIRDIRAGIPSHRCDVPASPPSTSKNAWEPEWETEPAPEPPQGEVRQASYAAVGEAAIKANKGWAKSKKKTTLHGFAPDPKPF